MKGFIRIISILLSLILISILLLYFLPQSQQVGPWLAKFLSKNNELSIKFSHIEHNLATPEKITIHNLSIKSADDDNVLSAQKLVVTLNFLSDFFTLSQNKNLEFKSIYIENGHVNLAKLAQGRTISSEQLYLNNVKYENKINQFHTIFSGVKADISHWNSQHFKWFENNTSIKFFASLAEFSYIDKNSDLFDEDLPLLLNQSEINDIKSIFGDRFTLKEVTFNGKKVDGVWFLDDLGFDWLSGSIAATGRFSEDSWRIDTLFINSIQRDFDFNLSKLAYLKDKTLQIKKLTVLNSSLSGIDWAIENIYFDTENIEIAQGQVKKLTPNLKSHIELTASKILYDDFNLNQINVSTEITPGKWLFRKMSVSFLNGFLSFDGVFDVSKKHLMIDKMVANEFSFTFQALPNSLNIILNLLDRVNELSLAALQVKNFSLQSTSPYLPWQIRNMTLGGKSIKLKENGVYSLFSGIFNGAASSFSLNKIDMSEGVSFALLADRKQLYFSNIHGASRSGYINIPKLSLSKTTPRTLSLTFNGQEIDRNIFTYWYLPSFILTHENPGQSINIDASLTGIIPPQFSLSSLVRSSVIPNSFDLAHYLTLTGEINAYNTANHGTTYGRFNNIHSFKEGIVISRKENKLPSIESLMEEIKLIHQQESMNPQSMIEVSHEVYSEINSLFGIYQDILSQSIDSKLNKLKTAPFFDVPTQDPNLIEVMPSE